MDEMDELRGNVCANCQHAVQSMMWSHPFVERLIGTIRRECLDRLLFWTATDLEMKLIAFRDYYNGYRAHAGLKGETPVATLESKGASLKSYRWRQHCRGLYQTPIAA
jgi:putative transposase